MTKALLIGFVFFSIILQTRAQAKKTTEQSKPFKPTETSLKTYTYPTWFRDAKLGYWAHWGPQALPRQGDWYARNMYIQGSRQNMYHVEHYGHPSKFGYKDIITQWKAERWDPDGLMKLFKKAGAKYFVSMASHHDNFFLWNSSLNNWNAVQMGPKKDIVGIWKAAAKKEGLYFGVSEHLAASFNWFQVSRGSDKTGSMAGIPYDGNDPRYAGLYHFAATDTADIKNWLTNNPQWHQRWLDVVQELIDKYQPDLLYSDSQLPFDSIGRTMLASYYNKNAIDHTRVNAVYTCKEVSNGKWVQDVERGVLEDISPFPWQTDTSIGDWYYRTGQRYKTADEIIQLLLDVVSKNGNLLINVVQTPEGDLEPDVLDIMDKISQWIKVNGEGIYGTRPWKVYGEGPTTLKQNQQAGRFGGVTDTRNYASTDIRYTLKDKNTLYAFVMNNPTDVIKLTSFSKDKKLIEKNIRSVSMLGHKEKITWHIEEDGLYITKPKEIDTWKVYGFKIIFQS